ncbi:Cytoplasmic polyadenylation element-binding protein 4 [Bagarius yarrelli]|uniref:Cytoplasmic polyadenylation element-binding protein 4 n=1 Tax=Bagarius yarrelli TaxID=175774 RepID=A0A556UZS7_BAGYA|nr:Cytoplasmic polyadenylation element-binding protein 4 [Bagarius yarrelli]
MGDYSFGVLIKNNASNKAVFPVRIHPHLQHPVHQRSSPPTFINTNSPSGGGNTGSAWLFPAVTAHANTQDETLESDKTKAQQQQQEDEEGQENRSRTPQGHQETVNIMSELEKVMPEEGQLDKGAGENGSGKEGLRIESPVLSGFDYQESTGIGTVVQSSNSSLPSFSSWSTAIPANPSAMMEEVGFFSQTATTANAAPPLLFQNFSHHASSGFGGSFSHQIGPLSQHHPPPPPPPAHFQHPHNQHQQNRRSPASPHPPLFNHRNAAFSQLSHLGNNLNKPPSPWGNYQSQSSTLSSSSWSPGGGYGGWGGSQGREYRRGLNGGITAINSISPLKKSFPNNQVSSQKYARNSSSFNPKPWMEDSINRNDSFFPFQLFAIHTCFQAKSHYDMEALPRPGLMDVFEHIPDVQCISAIVLLRVERSQSFDGFSMHSLENSLIDIMRAEQDSLKGRFGLSHPPEEGSLSGNGMSYFTSFPLPCHFYRDIYSEIFFVLLLHAARNYGRRRGPSSLFPMEDERSFGDDERSEQGLGGLGSPHFFPHQNGERIERYSRKVFVGGLPPDIDEDEITASFRRFGHLFVDWPHKAESKSYFPPKGYAFLLFQEESSVQALIDACMEEEGKLYLCVSSPTIKDKPVQIRPWNLNDSDFVMDGSQPLDPRKTIFVGGVPRPLRAVELAMIMDRLYGGVCYAGIDTDPELKYPKGAGRVAFSNQQSYIAAISARFVQLQHGEIDKRVEVKPYVLDDQLCDECQGTRCGGKFAPFFCANVTCLQYYCEYCWAAIHSRAGREFHKPLVKEGGDRPRHISFRWN